MIEKLENTFTSITDLENELKTDMIFDESYLPLQSALKQQSALVSQTLHKKFTLNETKRKWINSNESEVINLQQLLADEFEKQQKDKIPLLSPLHKTLNETIRQIAKRLDYEGITDIEDLSWFVERIYDKRVSVEENYYTLLNEFKVWE
jgi:hypothetical protein